MTGAELMFVQEYQTKQLFATVFLAATGYILLGTAGLQNTPCTHTTTGPFCKDYRQFGKCFPVEQRRARMAFSSSLMSQPRTGGIRAASGTKRPQRRCFGPVTVRAQAAQVGTTDKEKPDWTGDPK